MKIVFRCPPEWAEMLPRPRRAREALPDWLRAMPGEAASPLLPGPVRTLKHWPPLIDAMAAGWLMPLAADVKVEAGAFSWDWELPPSRLERAPRAPLGLHLGAQAEGSPFADPGRVFVKFTNFWTMEAPAGFSVLVTHPAGRPDLPFETLTGLVDCDRFAHGLVHFPARWRDPGFAGVLPAGTPVAQINLVPRGVEAEFATLEGPAAAAFEETLATVSDQPGGYRKRYRAPDRG